MASKQQEAYARLVDHLRIAIAVCFGVAGVGLIVASHLRAREVAALCSFLIAGSLLASFGLFIEYLVRSWIELRRRGVSRFSFSLRDLLGMVALTAIPLGMYGWLGAATPPAIIMLLIIAACLLESLRIKPTAEAETRHKSSDPKERSE